MTPRLDSQAGEPPHRIQDPGELAAALPALLGFTPADSLAVVCLADVSSPTATVSLVLRHDLCAGGNKVNSRMTAAFAQLASMCAQERAAGVVMFLIDSRHRDTGGGRADRTHLHETLAAELTLSLADYAIPVLGAHAATRIAAGAPWWSLAGDTRAGVMPDPASSCLAAQQVYAGRLIHGSRHGLADMLAPSLPDASNIRRELSEPAPVLSAPQLLRGIIAQAATPMWPLPVAQAAVLARGLATTPVRDAAYALATSELAGPAEQLWVRLTQILPPPWRAHAAAQLGFSAYVRGDGPLTGIALAAALEAAPEHGMAGLLMDALRGGMRPEIIRSLGVTSHEYGLLLGVDMPAQTLGPQL